MARIYLSATYEDLKDYRDKVYRILRKLQHDVVSMEDYVASEAYPLHKCLNDVADCDVYVGLIGWRYGYVPEQDNPKANSITELEYRQAGNTNKPRLLFLASPAVEWPAEFKDAHNGEGDSGKLIESLRSELEANHLVDHFNNPDHLASLVSAAVTNCLQRKPGTPNKRNEWFLSHLVSTHSQAKQLLQFMPSSGPDAKALACVFAEFNVECPETLAFKLLHRLKSESRAPEQLNVTVAYGPSTKPDEWLWKILKEKVCAAEPTAKAIQQALQAHYLSPQVFVLDLEHSQIRNRKFIAGLIQAWQSLSLNKQSHCLVLLYNKAERPKRLRRWGLALWAWRMGGFLGKASHHLIRPRCNPGPAPYPRQSLGQRNGLSRLQLRTNRPTQTTHEPAFPVQRVPVL